MAMMQAPDSGIRDMGACGASWVLGVDSPECGIDSGCLGVVPESILESAVGLLGFGADSGKGALPGRRARNTPIPSTSTNVAQKLFQYRINSRKISQESMELL